MKFELGWTVCCCARAGCGHPPRWGEPGHPRRGPNKCKSWARSSGDEKEFAIKRLKMLTLPWEGGNPCGEPVLQVTSVRKKNLSEGQRAKPSVEKFFRARAFERAFRKGAGRCLPRISFVVV